MAAAFGEAMRHAGVPTSTEQLGRFVRATTLMVPVTIDDLYWLGRVTLVVEHTHLDTYDRVFNRVFRGLFDWADSRGDASAPTPGRERASRDRPRSNREVDSTAEGGTPSVG